MPTESSRIIVLDTETTGLSAAQGDRIIEIGCVEMIDRKLTGNNYHVYINPERLVPEDAVRVHGITDEFLEDKPVFSQVAQEFLDFVQGAELVIHNAPFDVGFINMEFARLASPLQPIETYCSVFDTLAYALREKGISRSSSTLDGLCRYYQIDNSHRTLHGALLDAEILAEVYLWLTGGQTQFDFEQLQDQQALASAKRVVSSHLKLKILKASAEEESTHAMYLQRMAEKGEVLW